MALLANTFPAGTHIDAAKGKTNGMPITVIPAPDTVYLPLAMHIGAPAEPLVKVGDTVKLGQKIAKANGFVSSSIHASISGKVIGFERRYLPSGVVSSCIVIKNDGLDSLSKDILAHPDGSPVTTEKLRQIFQEKGVVGMGGATFPTHVKYAPPKEDQPEIDTVLLNGIECEPYITADHRVMLEQAEYVINGLKYFMQAAGVNCGIIAIEDNKPDAITVMQEITANEPNIRVCICPEKYPQGSEKQLIYAATGRIVPKGALPSAVGVIVDNVSTAVQAALAVEQAIPCYQRVVTVSGNGVNRPGNYLVRLGTLYSHVVETAGQGINGNLARILSGGPMMGFSLHSLDYPVMKGTSGLLLFNQDSPLAAVPPEQTCARCGRCVDVCPMFLTPTVIAKAVKRKDWSAATSAHITSCIECGSCSYNCPAFIPLVQYIRMGKQFIMTNGSGGHNPYFKK